MLKIDERTFCHWRSSSIFFILVSVLGGVGCVGTPPLRDYTLAEAALVSAKDFNALQYSSGNWHRAEEAFNRGKLLFERKEYSQAKDFFIKARKLAERAEGIARIKKFKSGDSF